MANKKNSNRMKRYNCLNYGECNKADAKEVIEIDALETLNGKPLCPYCKKDTLEEIPEGPVVRKIIAAIIAVVVIVAGAYFLLGNDSTGISLSKNTGKLAVGENDTLQATLSPDNATAQLKWATSDTTIIKVVDGVVTAVSPGTAKVGVQVVENKKLKAFCEYTVTEDGNDKVDTTVSIVPPTSTTLNVDSSVTLSAKVTPKGNAVSWTSSDESVASISADGKVTAIKAGNVDITAQNGDAKDAVKIEVKNNDETGYNFTFGTYKGGMRNGVPHGEGNITITKTVTIDCNNLEGETIILHRGDKISRAEIRNGYLQSGYFKIGNDERYVDGLNKRLK